jgi:hypothetical protein
MPRKCFPACAINIRLPQQNRKQDEHARSGQSNQDLQKSPVGICRSWNPFSRVNWSLRLPSSPAPLGLPVTSVPWQTSGFRLDPESTKVPAAFKPRSRTSRAPLGGAGRWRSPGRRLVLCYAPAGPAPRRVLRDSGSPDSVPPAPGPRSPARAPAYSGPRGAQRPASPGPAARPPQPRPHAGPRMGPARPTSCPRGRGPQTIPLGDSADPDLHRASHDEACGRTDG